MNSPKGIKWRWGRIKQQLKRHPGKRVARKGHTAVDRQVERDTGRPRLHDPTLPGVLLPEDQAGRKSLRKLQAPAWTSTQQEQLLGTGVTGPSPHPLVLHAAALGVWTGPRCGHSPQPGRAHREDPLGQCGHASSEGREGPLQLWLPCSVSSGCTTQGLSPDTSGCVCCDHCGSLSGCMMLTTLCCLLPLWP